MHRPPVLFLDEPTSGGPDHPARILTHINGSPQGRTIMVTTHFMDEAEYCDRVAMLSRAQLIALDARRVNARRSAPNDPTRRWRDAHSPGGVGDRELEAAMNGTTKHKDRNGPQQTDSAPF